MTNKGKKLLPNMDIAVFKIDEELLILLQNDKLAWNEFLKFPKLYQCIRIDNIQFYKKDKELFLKKLIN